MKSHYSLFVKLLPLVAITLLGLLAAAQDTDSDVVFRLGKFDRSSNEFAGALEFAPLISSATSMPDHQAHIMASRNTPTTEWYASQPVQLAGEAEANNKSNASPSRTIEFNIEGPPAKSYRLHVALLVESPGVPSLRVTVNDKHGMFYLHPVLDTEIGDQNDPADYSHADVFFSLPGSFVHKGSNTMSFQAVEEAPLPAVTLNYDAIELDRDQKAEDSQASSAEIDSTIFYRSHQGQLEELIQVFIQHSKQLDRHDTVDLELAGKHYRQQSQTLQDFGEERLEFWVPEFSPASKAKLTWSIGGRRQSKVQSIDPQKKWTVFVVPHIHLDVGFSDYQAKVAAIQSRVIDEAMALADQHPGFTFSVDGEWSLDQFLRTRSPADRQRAVTAIRNRQLFIPAQYACLLTGFPTAETLIRSFYPSANFDRLHNLPFDYANITDVPSYSWSYASILASAGIKDFVAGINGRNDRAPVLMWGHLNESSPMWWQGPDGQKVLFWYSRGYQQTRFLFGMPTAVAAGEQTLPIFLQQYEHPNYLAHAAMLYGTQPENTNLLPQQAELVPQWNALYAYPRLKYSGFRDALESIAHEFGDKLPTVRGDGGPFWEDGMATDAYFAAMERENESRAPSAEKLQTLMSLVNPRLAPDKQDLDRMWTNMVLMDEHTLDSGDGVREPTSSEASEQLAVKHLYAIDGHAMSDWLMREAMANIGDSIAVGGHALIVFNTLNWARSGTVSLDLTKGDEIVDSSTGQPVPYEVIGNGIAIRQVRFVAEGVPAMGYKTFLLRHETAALPVPAEEVDTTTLESPYYRVKLDTQTGAIKSIYDKELKRELVNEQSPYSFGQYLYVSGGDEGQNKLSHYLSVYPTPQLTVHPAHAGQLLSVTKTPDGCLARMRSTDTNTPSIDTEVRLFNNEKKIELIENVTKDKVYTKEGVYFAFPFAMSHPQFQYEIQNGVVDPAKDMYPGAGEEWFSVQHWVSAQQDGLSGTVMPLDASLVTLGDINRGAWPRTFGDRPGTIFSYVMNNYWHTNVPGAQGGHFRFRYIITSAAATDHIQLSRMGWEEMTPLEKDVVTTQDKLEPHPEPLDRTHGSFINVPDKDLLLETWKTAEDGNGTILRFLDLGGTARTVKVDIPMLRISQVWQTDAVERNKEQRTLDGTSGFLLPIQPLGIMTVRVVGESVMPGAAF